MATFDSRMHDSSGARGTESVDTAGRVIPPPGPLERKPDIPKKKLSWFVWMLITFGAMIMVALVLSFARTAQAPMPTIDTSAQDAPNREVRGATPDTENTPVDRADPGTPSRDTDDARRGRQEPTQVAPTGP